MFVTQLFRTKSKMPRLEKDKVEYHIYLHQGEGDSEALSKSITDLTNVVQSALPSIINAINQLREQFIHMEETVATDLSSIRNEVNEAKTVMAGAKTLIEGLVKALQDALAGNDVTGDVQAIADELSGASDDLATAIDNVPHPEQH